MKRGTYLRLLLWSVLGAVLLSAISFLGLTRILDLGVSRHRSDFLLFVAGDLENEIRNLTAADFEKPEVRDRIRAAFRPREGFHGAGHRPPPLPEDGPMGPPPPPEGMGGPPPGPGGDRRPFPEFWLVDENGQVLGSSTDHRFPVRWDRLEKPSLIHQVSAHEDFLRLNGGIFLARLDHPSKWYLALQPSRPFVAPLLVMQLVVTFSTVLLALIMSLSLTFFYLRRKSREAREVLHRLERGDLKARFEIRRLDEFGGLLLDFNRMAQEIEHLVARIHATERTRKNLLQELGHDLRTPVTSLTTSFETLRTHLDRITPTQREELFDMVEAEVAYLKDLLDKLMMIAGLDEPHYKQTAEWVDLRELLTDELRSRQSHSPQLRWELTPNDGGEVKIWGDPHLVRRLFRNAFDNASRFARGRVGVELSVTDEAVDVSITDDGPGLPPAELLSFGNRREQRRVQDGEKLHFSLGLGSVIMKAIAELHGADLQIVNRGSADLPDGAELKIRWPRRSGS